MASKIIVCGGKFGIGISNSQAIKNVLLEFGIPHKEIYLEELSSNTYENLKFAKKIIDVHKIKSILLVTSSSHMLRSLLVSKRLSFANSGNRAPNDVIVYPAPVPCYEKKFRSVGARIRHLYDLLIEYGAIVYFKLEGLL
ncbi:MAG: YdcF family protein [Oligoflexia bacterium]|nr:YdcF family protein [Oligoflexia bacterium]